MARQAAYLLLSALVITGLAVAVHSATVEVTTKTDVGRQSYKSSASASNGPNVAEATLGLLASKVDSTLAGLKAALGGVLRVAGLTGARYEALAAPIINTVADLLKGATAVRSAADKTMKGFLGLMLDNTKELRTTLEDGNAIIDIVRTLRGAKCEAASFDPPTAKPARIAGPGGSLKISTGSCTLKRVATPLKLDFVLECVEPGAALDLKAPRYTSRFVSAAKASSEVCKVTRKYGVESETTVTLFDAAQFFNAASATSDNNNNNDVEAAGGSANSALGVDARAGWAGTLFPLLHKKKLGAKLAGGRLTLLPDNVVEAVQKAIREASVDVTLNYKPFTLKADLLRAANSVADALQATFEVKQTVFKAFNDDLSSWGDAEKRAQMFKDLSFRDNLRESLGELNMTSLFDGMFAKAAGKLMSKTKVGKVLDGERPLRTLLSQVRAGAGQAIDVKLSASLEDLGGAAAGLGSGLSKVLAGASKGSVLGKLAQDKAALAQVGELSKLLGSLAKLDSGNVRAAQGEAAAGPADGGRGEGAAGTKGAAADGGNDEDGDGDAADGVTGGMAVKNNGTMMAEGSSSMDSSATNSSSASP